MSSACWMISPASVDPVLKVDRTIIGRISIGVRGDFLDVNLLELSFVDLSDGC